MTEEVNCIQIACKNVHKSFCIVFVEKNQTINNNFEDIF